MVRASPALAAEGGRAEAGDYLQMQRRHLRHAAGAAVTRTVGATKTPPLVESM
jgi:hypothetical protein